MLGAVSSVFIWHLRVAVIFYSLFFDRKMVYVILIITLFFAIFYILKKYEVTFFVNMLSFNFTVGHGSVLKIITQHSKLHK